MHANITEKLRELGCIPLAYHNIIPERVEVTQSAVMKRAKKIQTPLGLFSYMMVPADYYSVGINQEQTSTGQTFLIASPEKALPFIPMNCSPEMFAAIREMPMIHHDRPRPARK